MGSKLKALILKMGFKRFRPTSVLPSQSVPAFEGGAGHPLLQQRDALSLECSWFNP
jgi:hypothetical protein